MLRLKKLKMRSFYFYRHCLPNIENYLHKTGYRKPTRPGLILTPETKNRPKWTVFSFPFSYATSNNQGSRLTANNYGETIPIELNGVLLIKYALNQSPEVVVESSSSWTWAELSDQIWLAAVSEPPPLAAVNSVWMVVLPVADT